MSEEIEILLRERAAVKADSMLAERIVVAARQVEYKTDKSGNTLWQEVMHMFVLPRPVLAAACCLFLGIVIGIEMTSFFDASLQDWDGFLRMDEGDWL
jgi:hypothetical protein